RAGRGATAEHAPTEPVPVPESDHLLRAGGGCCAPSASSQIGPSLALFAFYWAAAAATLLASCRSTRALVAPGGMLAPRAGEERVRVAAARLVELVEGERPCRGVHADLLPRALRLR